MIIWFFASGMRSCCRQWRHELDDLRRCEDRLNITFSERAAEAARLRAAAAPEAEATHSLALHSLPVRANKN